MRHPVFLYSNSSHVCWNKLLRFSLYFAVSTARCVAWLSQDVCPSACLSSHAGIVPKLLNTASNFFSDGKPHHSSCPVPNLIAIFRRGIVCKWGMKKSRFSTNISLYLENDTRQGHSYYWTPIETRMRSIEWYHFQCLWVILIDLAKYPTTRNMARPLCHSLHADNTCW